jgi:hypothetical protein
MHLSFLGIFRRFEEHRGDLLALREAVYLEPNRLEARRPARACLEG